MCRARARTRRCFGRGATIARSNGGTLGGLICRGRGKPPSATTNLSGVGTCERVRASRFPALSTGTINLEQTCATLTPGGEGKRYTPLRRSWDTPTARDGDPGRGRGSPGGMPGATVARAARAAYGLPIRNGGGFRGFPGQASRIGTATTGAGRVGTKSHRKKSGSAAGFCSCPGSRQSTRCDQSKLSCAFGPRAPSSVL